MHFTLMLKHVAHERAICRIPLVNSITGDKKKIDRSLTDQHFSMLCFYESIRTGNCLWTQHFDRRCVCNPAVKNAGISV